MRTLVATTLWLLAGAAVAGGVFWAFLSTPESNIFTLALSAILLLALYFVVALTVNGAVLAWHRRGWSFGAFGSALWGVPAFVVPVLIVALAWLLAGGTEGWVERNQGPISAFFIARFGWSDVLWLFTAVEWAARWVRWILGPMIAMVWLRRALTESWRPGWPLVREGLSPLRLLVATAAFFVLAYLPWVYLVPWRPRWIPTDSIELAFVAVKLGLFAVLAATGVALMIRSAAHTTAPPGPPILAAPPGPPIESEELPVDVEIRPEVSAPPA